MIVLFNIYHYIISIYETIQISLNLVEKFEQITFVKDVKI